jgi:chromate transporter
MSILRHIPFLKQVAIYACSAFGGPSAHIGAMSKTFVDKRRDVTQQELTEIFSFCQMLPGPSSTQTVTLIGYKRGGTRLAILTLLIWLLPATLLMTAFALWLTKYKNLSSVAHPAFTLVQPMAIGFLLYAIVQAMKFSIKHFATFCIMIVAAVVSAIIRSPWMFPVLLIVGGFISNLSSKRIPTIKNNPTKIQWRVLVWFFILFALIGILSEAARLQHWQNARVFNLFENFYRFGSLTWGGGHALMPIMREQFIALPQHRGSLPWLSNTDFLTGFGMMNMVPGPVFSVSAFVGAMSMEKWGTAYQLLGATAATVGVFLPSTMLVIFLFPIYKKLQQHTVIFRALEGIAAVVIGTMWASGFLLCQDISLSALDIGTILSTFLVLYFTKLPAPIWVIICIVLGYVIDGFFRC